MKKQKGKSAGDYYTALTDLETGEVKTQVPEFAVMSRRPGIGQLWFDKYRNEVYPSDTVYINGKLIKPPKYFDEQLEKLDPEKHARVKGKRKEQGKKNWYESTTGRLITKEKIKNIQTKSLKRSLEND